MTRPHHAPNTERAVLAACLLDSETVVPIVRDVITPDDFADDRNRRTFDAILQCAKQGQPLDSTLVMSVLSHRGQMDEQQSSAVLACTNTIPDSANAERYAEEIRNLAAVRRVERAAGLIRAEASAPIDDVPDFLDRSEAAMVAAVEHRTTRNTVRTFRDVTHEAISDLVKRAESPTHLLGLPTGFAKLDDNTGGYMPGDVTVVAGRPGMGKTSFALCSARAAARQKTAIFFSLEMPSSQIVTRALSIEGGINQMALRTGRLRADEMSAVMDAADLVQRWNILIDDTPAMQLSALRHLVRKWNARTQGGIGLVVIDYLQLLRHRMESRNANREQEISEISRGLKALAKEAKVHVMALAQLNREAEKRGNDKRPRMSDLRESGSIEQDADNIIMLYRDEVYDPDSKDAGTAELILEKQRNGPTGTIRVAFQRERTLFADLEPSYGSNRGGID